MGTVYSPLETHRLVKERRERGIQSNGERSYVQQECTGKAPDLPGAFRRSFLEEVMFI
jgi:hypothetical protein